MKKVLIIFAVFSFLSFLSFPSLIKVSGQVSVTSFPPNVFIVTSLPSTGSPGHLYISTSDSTVYLRTSNQFLPVGSILTNGSIQVLNVDSLTVTKYAKFYVKDSITVAVLDTFGHARWTPRWSGFFNVPAGNGILEDTTFYDGDEILSRYQWRSTETTFQTDTVGLELVPPFYFPGFSSSTSDSSIKVTFWTQSSSTSNNKAGLVVYKKSDPANKIIIDPAAASSDGSTFVVDLKGDRTVLSNFSNTDVLILKFPLYSKDNWRAGVCSVDIYW